MSKKTIEFINSFGERQITCGNINVLKNRKEENVLPEVMELMERIEKRGGSLVSINNISLELGVHPSVVGSIFRGLAIRKVVETDKGKDMYKIIGKVENEDYEEV